jgi:3-phenylpropionate/trans-cinnamate dioxygenase ferredoxin subunit
MYNYHKLSPDQCEFIPIAPVGEIPPGDRLFVEIDGNPIVVFNIAGEYYAIADVCSHDDGPLGEGELDGFEVSCPRHGAEFDVRIGKVLSLPAVVDIPAYPIRVVGDEIEIGLPVGI